MKVETSGYGRIAERPPDPFAGAGVHEQAVGIVQFAAEVVGEPTVGLAEEIHRGSAAPCRARVIAFRANSVTVASTLVSCPGVTSKRKAPVAEFAVEQRMDDDVLRRGVRRLDPEFAKERELLVDLRAGADGEAARREAVALPAAEKTEVTSAEKRDHLVHDMRSVDRDIAAESRQNRG